jgi:pyruvate kinase
MKSKAIQKTTHTSAFEIAILGLPILALTPNINTARRLALAWGVHAVVTKDGLDAFLKGLA